MNGSGKKVVPWADGPPSCFTGDLQANAGVVVTIVVARGAGQCRDLAHNELGVVFFGATPVMWTCLAGADIAKFEAWGLKNFAGARTLQIAGKLAVVVCPPPLASPQELDAAAAQMRGMLTDLGKTWLASAIPAAPRRIGDSAA
jgi:hypothetical protein